MSLSEAVGAARIGDGFQRGFTRRTEQMVPNHRDAAPAIVGVEIEHLQVAEAPDACRRPDA